MEIAGLIVTIIILALLFTAVFKKLNMQVTLCFLSVVAMIAVILLGRPGITAKSGLPFFDIFEYVPSYFGTTFTGTALIILFVVAASNYFKEIGASQRLAEIMAVLVMAIKNKVLLLTVSTAIAFLLMMVLPSALGVFVVCLAVLYPTLKEANINPITIFLSFFVGSSVILGPASPYVAMVLGMIDGAPDMATFFVQYAFPVGFVTIVLAGVVSALWNLHCDKSVETFPEVQEPENLGINTDAPKWYALFPILPVVLLIVFSNLTGIGITFSVAGGYFFGLVICFILHWLVSKNKRTAYDNFSHFFAYFGDVMRSPVIIVCLSMLFGNVIAKVGGLDFLVNWLITTFGLGWIPLLVVVTILYFIMCIFVGNSIAIPVCVPIVTAAMVSMGMESNIPLVAILMTFTGGLGKVLTPYEPKYLYISELCNGYDTMDLIKRNSLPAIFSLVFSLILSIALFG